MEARLRILSVFLLLAAMASAREHTDVIILTNGDRITGEIKGLDSGVLRLDLDYVDGAVSIQWLKVKRLESSQLFIVQAQDGSIFTGTLADAPAEPLKIEVAEPGDKKTALERSQVVRLEETSESFFQRWSGDINLGVVYSKGNSATQYTLGSAVEYRRNQWGIQTDFNSSLSSNSGSETSTRNQVNLGGHRMMPWKNYFYGGLGSFLQSSVQGIQLQSTYGGGLGRYFKNTNRTRISVLAGVAWQSTNYEHSKTTVSSQQDGAGLIAADVRVFIFKKTNLGFKANLLPSVTDRGRIHFNNDVSYYLKLFRNFSWNLSFYGNWDTRPPEGFSGSDYGYSSGVKWTFGYR